MPTMRLRQAARWLGGVALVAVRRLIAARRPTWAPTGERELGPKKGRNPGGARAAGRGYPRVPRPPRYYPTPCASCARCPSGTWPPSRRRGRRPPGAPPPSRSPRPAPRRTRTRRARAASPPASSAPCRGPRCTRAPADWGACARTPCTASRTGHGRAGARSRRCGSRGRPKPRARAVEGVVPAAVGLAGVLGTAAARAAGDDTTDRAQLHPRIIGGDSGSVYSPAVLRLRGHGA